jgi:hypothetical protein
MKRILFYCFLIFITACTIDDSIELVNVDRVVAVPLAYGQLSLQDAIERSDNAASIKVDNLGRLTAFYSSEVLRENSAKVFPPVPGIFEFPIIGTTADVPLPVNGSYRIDKGVFDNTNIFFNVTHNVKEVLKLKITMPYVSRDGKTWSQDYTLDFTNSLTGLIATPVFNMDKWTALPKENKIRFQYTATRPNGTEIVLTGMAMKFDILRFSYLDGYFGNHVFDIKSSTIKLNIYDGWKKGGIIFENPTISLNVENAFGFPVRSKINSLYAKTIDNNQFVLESEFINKGINFNYPVVDGTDRVKTTAFKFDGTNSNIGKIFQNKIAEISYDFDAIANPEGDNKIKNFFNSDAYFSINVGVELPMKLSIDDLTIEDTVDFEIGNYNDIKNIELSLDLKNKFPLGMKLDAKLLDKNNKEVYRLDAGKGLDINPALIGTDGKTKEANNLLKTILINEVDFKSVLNAKKVILTARFDSKSLTTNTIWLYNTYDLDFKLGAKIGLK